MTIIAHKQTILFVASDGRRFQAKPEPGAQQVPDWVRDTETFKMAVKSGFVAEINTVSAPAEPQKQVDTPELGFETAPASTIDASHDNSEPDATGQTVAAGAPRASRKAK